MLKNAVKGRVPLIHVVMDDTVYAKDVLVALTGVEMEDFQGIAKVLHNRVYFKVSRNDKGLDDARMAYIVLQKAGSTLIYVNLSKPTPEFLSLGAVAPPPGMVKQMLATALGSAKEVDSIALALGGLSVKDSINVVRCTKGRDGKLTTEGIVKTRKSMLKEVRGLTLVDPYLPAYVPDPQLALYVAKERKFFLNGHDSRLRPRGVLFDGPPGTGKTQGAKYIAREWGLPLYRIDATFSSKWVGESEGNFSLALKTAESGAPCVLLVDEIEKFFSGSKGDSSGIMQRVMGSLLWWLQEHDARVLTVMTTNDKSAIPPELYREGRLDRVFVFNKLNDVDSITEVMTAAWESYTGEKFLPTALLKLVENHLEPDGISHTKVVSLVREYVKDMES